MTNVLSGEQGNQPASTLPPAETRVHEPRVLFIVSNDNRILKPKSEGDQGHKTGMYLPEIAHIWVPLAKRVAIEVASPNGGAYFLDESSVEQYKDDPLCKEFMTDDTAQGLRFNTKTIEHCKADDYIGIVIPGGHGPMFDLADSGRKHVHEFIAAVWENEHKGFVASVCHGPAALLEVVLPSEGRRLIEGKKVTSFSDEEEKEMGLVDQVPFLLEAKIKEYGGQYTKASKPWDVHVVSDGRLLTGQNPNSARPLADAILSQISAMLSKGLQHDPVQGKSEADVAKSHDKGAGAKKGEREHVAVGEKSEEVKGPIAA
ncbi:class I glutamine amidotransferase-like protein [Gonapodya prolifera JEL478]|uniref:D-lactate dehydratase n=1 Tax=Gonapodya prolifera (strain JEL478) TaxID=1344416 RepID=A0A139AGW5_GONPJ|nr:class I glutamine amidotransferase-like protein [Gonapodya prolifera JEL478]|eukprot:KXS15988.1 class I glutamine amidotransferase-like protein [Gonapodya prolifera JEL478]